MLNTCAACPNARRSSIHLPRLQTARDQARDAFQPASGRQLPPLQRVALTGYLDTLDRLIAEIDHEGPAPP